MRNTPLALSAFAVCLLVAGGLLAGSAQMRVNAGATWEEAPPDSWLQITTGDRRHGTHEVILNTNGDHWSVGLMAAGGGLLLLLGMGAMMMIPMDEDQPG